jgi:predicted ester cyclase
VESFAHAPLSHGSTGVSRHSLSHERLSLSRERRRRNLLVTGAIHRGRTHAVPLGSAMRDAAATRGERGTERSCPMAEEIDLSEEDQQLSQRARDLIRIGRVAIANEDQASAEAFFHPDFRFHAPDDSEMTREQLWAYFAACRLAFDDFSVTRQQIFSDGGDLLAARTTFRGVFARPFTASPLGTLQPHGRPVWYKIHNVFRYADDGRLIEEWAQYDSRLFLERLGVQLVER